MLIDALYAMQEQRDLQRPFAQQHSSERMHTRDAQRNHEQAWLQKHSSGSGLPVVIDQEHLQQIGQAVRRRQLLSTLPVSCST